MIEVFKDLVCKIRLCNPDILIHHGLVEIKVAEKSTKNKGVYLTIKQCGRCGRKINRFWSKREKEIYKRKHGV